MSTANNLVGLAGGGFPAHDASFVSTVQGHPLGTRAHDSSGGEYIYMRASSAALTVGQVVVLTGATFQAVVASSAASISTVQGSLLAVAVSSGGSTANFMWAQTHGPALVLGDSTAAGTGVTLFTRTTVAGALSVPTTGVRLSGAHIMSSNASSLWNVYLNAPRFSVA